MGGIEDTTGRGFTRLSDTVTVAHVTVWRLVWSMENLAGAVKGLLN